MASARPWLRLYRRTVDNAKLMPLGLEAVGFWTALLCLSDDDGYLPSPKAISWRLRIDETVTETFLKRFHETRLVTKEKDGRLRLHDWDEHQWSSDKSTDRVRKHREKRQKEEGNTFHTVTETATKRRETVTVTAPESEHTYKKESPPTPPPQKSGPKPGGGDGMFDGFCLAMNLTPNEMLRLGSTWSMAKAEYATWIEAGAIPELDIWPTVKAVTEKYRDSNPGMKAPNTPRYFTQAILRAVEVRKATMPETASSVVTGPNGKVLNDHGKPWRLPPKDAIWFPQFRWWFTRRQVELSIIDATQHGNICPLLYDLELKPQPWLPEWARILIQEAGEPRKPDTWGVYSDRLGKWPVRSPNELQRVLKDYFEALSTHATIIPADWKPEVAA